MTPRFKVLIVEDSAIFRQLLKESLQDRFRFMEIDGAVDPTEALQKLEPLLPDLIFIDIELRGENGLKLAKEIKTRYPGVAIIILTAYDLPEYREAARQYTHYFLSKGSSTREQILGLVQSILSSRQ